MERFTASRARAIAESLRKFDLSTAQALATHADWLQQAEHALREANIQLAAPHLQTATVVALRDQIDRLLDIVPRPMPICQEDGS
jgi:hypothetical protein